MKIKYKMSEDYYYEEREREFNEIEFNNIKEWNDLKKNIEEQIEYYRLNNKFIVYTKNKVVNDNRFDCYRFTFFEEWDNYTLPITKTKESFEPKHKLNYYLLIERKHYKNFKNSEPIIFFNIFPDIIKFIKDSKKKVFKFNNKQYIKLKLRKFSNTFRSKFDVNIRNNKPNFKPYDFLNHIEIISTPVKSPYSNLIEHSNFNNYEEDYEKYIDGYEPAETYDITDTLTLYITSDCMSSYSRFINKKYIDRSFQNTIELFEDFYINNNKRILDYNPKVYLKILFMAFIYNKNNNTVIDFGIIGYIKESQLNKENFAKIYPYS